MSKVTTKTEVRLSYANLLEPRAQNDEHPEILTFATSLLIPKTDLETVNAIKAAIKEALDEGKVKKWGGKLPGNLKNPLRDGDADRADDDVYKGMWFIGAKGPRGGAEQPILLDKTGNETTSASVIYSGVHARVSIQFYPYDKNGNRGVACGVTSVLSAEHGEPLGNTVTAASARDEFGVSTPAGNAAKEFATGTAKPEASASDSDDEDPWAS